MIALLVSEIVIQSIHFLILLCHLMFWSQALPNSVKVPLGQVLISYLHELAWQVLKKYSTICNEALESFQ